MKILAAFIHLVVLSCIFPVSALSGVIVHDVIALKGEKVMLRAETKGRFFSKGGELVEFFVDGKSLGKTLSGGDGVAFRPFTPTEKRLYQIRVSSGEDENDGLLLCLKKGSSVVFVDVVGGLLEGQFSRKAKPGSQNAIREINKRFPTVFLQEGIFSVKTMKTWLRENEFVALPVVPWRRGAIFDEIAERGLRIKAVVGSPKVVESTREYKPLSFSFRSVNGTEWVKDWDEIRKKLK